MKAIRKNGGAGAFTLLELLCVTAVLVVLAAALLHHNQSGSSPMAVPASAWDALQYAVGAPCLAGAFDFS